MTEDKSRVEQLSESLNSRTRYHDPSDTRSPVKPLDMPETEEKWQGGTLSEMLAHEREPAEVNPFMKRFFLFALLFFVATVGVATLVFFGGVNFISSKNVDIEVVGPTTVAVGQMMELGISIKNGNNSDLELANFSIQFPSGSRDPLDSGKALSYSRESLGLIKAGSESARNVRTVLIGASGETKEFKLSLEYKVKGSNATFYKDKLYQVTMGEAPLSLSIESPSSVTSGDSFTTTLSVTLNSTEVLKNVMLRAEYPYGFSLSSAVPSAISENNVWSLGDLSPGTTKKIQLKGILIGENQDERTFRFYLGASETEGLSPNFKTVILSSQETISIERPSIGLSVVFNGDNSQTYVTPAGRAISTTVRVKNNLPEKLINPQLEVRLAGTGLNKNSVTVYNGGVYSQSGSKINWNLSNSFGLTEFSPGEGGEAQFLFASLPEALSTGSGSEMSLQFILSGTPTGSSKPISVTETRKVKIASQIVLSARAVRSIGPFENTGPIPPKVDQETTYTVLWSVVNTQTGLNSAKLTAKLGAKVSWVRDQGLPDEKVSYDEKTGVVTWNIGELESSSDVSSGTRNTSFQIKLKPSLSQVGTVPTLLGSIALSGVENIRGENVSVTAPALTTRISTDPAFIQGDDIVVK